MSGVRTLLNALRNRVEGKTHEIWEEASGFIAEYINGKQVVTASLDSTSGSVTTISKLTQAQYDALAVKDNSTLYIIVG